MADCCRNNGDFLLCVFKCFASRYIDKQLENEPRKWVIVFAIRVWIGYIVDAATFVLVWQKIGLPGWLDTYKIPIIVYVVILLSLTITLSVIVGVKWQLIADNYHPKIWRLIFVLFKVTTGIHAGFIFSISNWDSVYGVLTSVVAIIDMVLCSIEILRVLLCFCDWCPCAYHPDDQLTCCCINCWQCKKDQYQTSKTDNCRCTIYTFI